MSGTLFHLPDAATLLDAWDRARTRRPLERPLALLEALRPSPTAGTWAQEPLGLRDQHLFGLHEQLFGSSLPCTADCPHCAETVEFEVPPMEPAPAPTALPRPLVTRLEGFVAECRLPNSADLIAAEAEPDAARARLRILSRCMLSVNGREPGDPEVRALPEDFVKLVARRLGEADPQADIALRLECPECHRHWEAPFDIGGYLWTRLHAWASRLLGEVHELARAYGWSETDILRLSPTRRQAYLELVRA